MAFQDIDELFDDECARCGDPLPFSGRVNSSGICDMCVAKERLRPEPVDVLFDGELTD